MFSNSFKKLTKNKSVPRQNIFKMKYLIIIICLLGLGTFASSVSAGDQCGHRKIDSSTAVCTLFPESMEGPYYLEGQANRSDITEGKPGLKLELHITVVNFTTCEPLPNVAVDLWQCDHVGDYSSFQTRDDKTFLRGVQYTDADGVVVFKTIFPGWYTGRTVHIHVDAWVNKEKHTGQIYFSEVLTAEVAKLAPYTEATNVRTTNAQDFIYQGSNGAATTLAPSGSFYDGLRASILMGFER